MMKNRWCGALLALVLVLTLLPTAVFAADGTGTPTDPILIGSVEGLKDFRDRVNGTGDYTTVGADPDLCAKLTCDIVLNDGTFDADGRYTDADGRNSAAEQWTPIGSGRDSYSGTFDGDGKTIQGLYINSDQSEIGLFGSVKNATIRNLTVTGYVKGGNSVGSLVGRAENSTIQNCVNRSNVTGTTMVGGLVGAAAGGSINIQDCINYGNVKGEKHAGGIMGHCRQGTIANCANLGKVEGTGAYIGGIVGYIVNSTVMTSCYNVGQVEGAEPTGGLVGSSGWWESSGIYTSSLTVNNCYYLDTAAQKALGEAAHFEGDTSAWCKTKTEFADGTVLDLLKRSDTTNAWGVNGYLEAAKMTLPLLSGQQADDHTHSVQTGICTEGIKCACGYEMYAPTSGHNWGNWVHNTTSHRRGCDNPGCGMTQSENCTSDGSATCQQLAKCTVCGGELGVKADHSFTAENTAAQYLKFDATCTAAAVYYKSCAVCGEEGTDTFTSGAPDPDNHANLTHTAAVAATTSAEGNIEYWHCTGCDKYYADALATQLIAQADTVIAKLPGSTSRPSRPSVADTAAKDIRNAEPGETVRIAMKGETKLPARVLDAAYGKDITLEIDMGNGAVWTINGLDIPKGGVSLNLGVRTGVTTIPVKVINAITGEVSTVQFQLSHSGAFGLPLTLSLELGKAFDGMFANLYYYDETTGELDFQCSGKIRGGTASWPFTRASEYAIVIDETDHEPMRFADVADGAYYRDAVLWAAKNGITGGISDTAFGPELPCTRAQIVTFLWRAAGSPVVNYVMSMDDVNEGSYYAEAVRWALSEGITTGTAANAFSPDEPCTRAQAVTFLARAQNAKASGKAAFSDVPSGSYYADAVAWAAESGITTGTSDTTFSPDEVCTRAQIVTFLWRAFQ